MEERLSGCAWRLTQARTLLTMSWLSRDIPYNRLARRVCYLAAPDAGRDRGQVERAQEIASTLTADRVHLPHRDAATQRDRHAGMPSACN